MKSFKSVINVLPLSVVSPPLPFIDDTKVRQVAPMVKDMILHLLKKMSGAFIGFLIVFKPNHAFFNFFIEKNRGLRV